MAYGYFKFAFTITLFLIALNLVLNITAKKIKPIPILVDNDSNAYLLNIVCLKEQVAEVKDKVYNKISVDKNTVNSISVNNITPDKFRINIKVGTGLGDEYFVKLTNELFEMNVLSVSYEKLEQ